MKPNAGNADVMFDQKYDAIQAVKRFNNLTLDGRPMKVFLKDSNQVCTHAFKTFERDFIFILHLYLIYLFFVFFPHTFTHEYIYTFLYTITLSTS